MAAGDPYNSIKHELDTELQLITSLQAKLFAGHPEAAPQLRSHLANVGEQLHALETAVKSMVDNPARFQLDSTTAFMRQVSSPCKAAHAHVHQLHSTHVCGTLQLYHSQCIKEM
jgi:hypothetical protein